MDGIINVDEFILGSKEQGKIGRSHICNKKKALTAAKLTKEGKVELMSTMKIEDFTARYLQYIFIKHISLNANVTTNKIERLQAYCQSLK